jgi:hypothetical protein
MSGELDIIRESPERLYVARDISQMEILEKVAAGLRKQEARFIGRPTMPPVDAQQEGTGNGDGS